MSFNIEFYYNNSEKNKLSKDIEYISTPHTLSGALRDGCSLMDPVILIEYDSGDIANIRKCNYMHIATFGRYYFINNIKVVRTDLIEISAHVDVLMSYQNAIQNCTGIVKRSKNKWNLYLNDGSFKVYQNPNVLAKEFPSGFSTYEFVLAVAGS